MKPLPPPEDATNHGDSVEVLRGWVVGGDLQVSLAFEAFGNHPEMWGQLLAEVAVHVADAMSAEKYGERGAIFSKIKDSLLQNLAKPAPGLTGTVRDPVQ
jgi:hypothetical protein